MKYLFLMVFTISSLFAMTKELSVQEVLDRDIRTIKDCAEYSWSGSCKKNLKSFSDFDLHKTVESIMQNNKVWNDFVQCSRNSSSTSCDEIVATQEVSSLEYILEEMSMIDLLGIGIIGFLVVIWLTSFFTIVKQKTAEVIEVFGKFSSVKRAGLNLKPPFPLGVVAGTVNLQIRELKSDVGVKSSDKAFLTVPVKVQFRVLDPKIKEAHYELDDPEQQMKSYILNMVRSKASSFTMDQLFASKDNFENDVKTELNEKFSPFGYEIVNVLVDDPQPSEEVVLAFNRVLAAEREKDAAINEAEALKIKLVGEAKAEKESLILKGEAFKSYRALMAEGNIEAMGLMKGTHELIEEEIDKEVIGENGKTTTVKVMSQKIQKRDTPISSDLTDQSILDFFAGIDQREAIRDAAKGEGNTVVVPVSPNESTNYTKLAGMIKALNQ